MTIKIKGYELTYIKTYFEKRDLWIGLYWDTGKDYVDIYICFIPLFPLNLFFQKFDD